MTSRVVRDGSSRRSTHKPVIRSGYDVIAGPVTPVRSHQSGHTSLHQSHMVLIPRLLQGTMALDHAAMRLGHAAMRLGHAAMRLGHAAMRLGHATIGLDSRTRHD